MNKMLEFFKCTRPHSYPAAIAPVLVGTTFALNYTENFSWIKFLLFLIACVLIQAATNLFNEYYDYKKGLDKIDSEGISGSIVKGKLTSKEVMVGAIVLYIASFLIGIVLTTLSSYYVLLVGLVSMLVGYLYTGGPYPIAYSPLGEVFSGFFMGTIIIGLAFYFQTKYINIDVIILSIPIFLLIAGIMLTNNIRDLANDKESGRKTYAIIVGKNNAVNTLVIFFIIVYLLNIIFIFSAQGSIFNVIVLISIPLAKKIIVGFRKNNDKKTMAPFMVMTAKLTIIVGFLMAIANLLTYIIL